MEGKGRDRRGEEWREGRRKGRNQRKQVTTKVQASTACQLPLRENGPSLAAVAAAVAAAAAADVCM
jgi:hypothetical protein